MENFEIQHSLKDIPTPKNSEYLELLVDKVASFLRRFKWMAFFKLNPDVRGDPKEKYGFKSSYAPPQITQQNYGEHHSTLKAFENEVYCLVRRVEFNKYTNKYQEELKDTLDRIKQSKDLIVAADKTRNFYSIKPENYEKMRHEDITKTYKRADRTQVNEVNACAAKIARSLELEDRMQVYKECEAFLSVKDHKPEFPAVVKRRLLNPAKSDIGRVSKVILQRVNADIIKKTGLKLCRSTGQVLEWYKEVVVSYRGNMSFLLYDIEEYYPSISPTLLNDALDFAKKYTKITDEEIEIILQARKTFLFCNSEPWIKKDETFGNFDVPQGAYDSCEVCELCGLLLLEKTSSFVPMKNNILYRDDGLMALDLNGQNMQKVAEKLIATFKHFGLKLVVQTNAKIVEYLDLKLNLNDRTHRAYKKPNDRPVYVNSLSNHPPAVIKSLPENINNRLSMLACNEKVFEEDKIPYQEALKNAGYSKQLKFKDVQNGEKKKTRHRGRQVCWFNPPWSANVKTPVGKMFLDLVNRFFPHSHPLHKEFNRNTLKMSYCTCKNLKAHIDGHNRNILQPKVKTKGSCNCKPKFKENCPLPGECQTSSIVYQCDVITEENNNPTTKTYFGQTLRPFKKRYYEHNTAMKYPHSKLATALSNYVWKLKNLGRQFTLKWSIKNKAPIFKSGSRKCQLCLKEKTAIALASPEQLLNSRTELLNKCIHLTNFELRKVKQIPP